MRNCLEGQDKPQNVEEEENNLPPHFPPPEFFPGFGGVRRLDNDVEENSVIGNRRLFALDDSGGKITRNRRQ